MAKGKVEIKTDHCKGCQLCMTACKFSCLALSAETQTNRYGYRYAIFSDEKCVGCTLCAIMCPDHAMTVYRE
jgi:2-oxoglutarate ferredoxin oxidoreductase subunit delta